MSVDKAPMARLAGAGQKLEEKTVGLVKKTTEKTGSFARGILREEIGPTEESSLIGTPFKMAGNILDGTVGNAARRTSEILSPIASGLGSLYNTTLRVIPHPIDTLTSPFKYGKNVLNIITSTFKLYKNAIMIPIRGLAELVDRTGARTLEHANYKIDNIPIVGAPIAGITNGVAGAAKFVTGGINKGADWITSPIDWGHKATSS